MEIRLWPASATVNDRQEVKSFMIWGRDLHGHRRRQYLSRPARVGAGMERTTADYMGMLATVMNALAVQSALEGIGVFTRVISAIRMDEVAEPYIRRRAVRHLEKSGSVSLQQAPGTLILRPIPPRPYGHEMACEAIFMGKNGVDGVYDKDPKDHADAVRYDEVSYDEVLAKRLKVMDASAIALARDNNLPLIVFSL